MDTYKFHDIANMYPMAMPSEFELLKQSIKDKGQKQPIIIYDNKILDGRNRYKACQELSIEPIYEVINVTDDEALDYSIELNSGRRNLDKSQKAMVGAYSIIKSRLNGSNKIKISDASKVYGVSDKYIKDALFILDNNEKVAQQVFDGLESVSSAKKRVQNILCKESDIEYIEKYLGTISGDEEIVDTYGYLFGLEKSELVNIIMKSEIFKKGN